MGCGFSFVHCADLHLGSRAWGFTHGDRELSDRFFGTSFRSFSRIVDVCIDRADFMVIAGDVYDELVETPRTRLYFASEMKRLGKPCFIVTGNHDHVHSWSDSIPYPGNVYQFGTSPQAYRLRVRNCPVEVTGVSFSGPHTSDNLVSKLRGSPGHYTIGVAHCSVSSSDRDPYAPCSMEDFLGRDVQYWALGHIHKRSILRDSEPFVVYPGNIQGRDAGECGEKGCMLVTVDDGETSLEFIPTQEITWRSVTVDITGMETLQQVAAEACKDVGSDSIICLDIIGRGPLNHVVRSDPSALADGVTALSGCPAHIRSIACGPEIDMEQAAEGGTIVSDVIRASERFSSMTDDELLDLLCARGPAVDLRPYLSYFAKHGKLRELVEEAKLSVIHRILEGGQ